MHSALTRATFAQKARLRMLLARAEYDTHAVTFMHRRLGVPDRMIGKTVDSWIDSLSIDEASALIGRLEQETSV